MDTTKVKVITWFWSGVLSFTDFTKAKSAIDTSSLVMAIFCEVVAPRVMPADGLLIVKMAVSAPSTNASFTTLKVAVPVVLPLGMVMVTVLVVKVLRV